MLRQRSAFGGDDMRYHVLGPLSIQAGDQTVLRGPKQRRPLAALIFDADERAPELADPVVTQLTGEDS